MNNLTRFLFGTGTRTVITLGALAALVLSYPGISNIEVTWDDSEAAGASIRPHMKFVNVTAPERTKTVWAGDQLELTITGEPNAPVTYCSRFNPSARGEKNQRSCTPATNNLSPEGTWSTSFVASEKSLGQWTIWTRVGKRISNELKFKVVTATATPTPTWTPTPTPPTTGPLSVSLVKIPEAPRVITGTRNVLAVAFDVTNTSSQDVEVRKTTLMGYYHRDFARPYYAGSDGTRSVADLVQDVRIVDQATGVVIAGPSSNNLNTTGEVMMSDVWTIQANETRHLGVVVDLTNNAVEADGEFFSFDLASLAGRYVGETTDTFFARYQANGGTSPVQAVSVLNGGALTAALAPDSPASTAVFWGQQEVPFSKFRIIAAGEGYYLEKLTLGPDVLAEQVDAAANISQITVTYRDRQGNELSSVAPVNSRGIVNFGWTGALRPYVPRDSLLTVTANLKTEQMGATAPVQFSIDILNTFMGSAQDGFRAVGENSGTVLNGSTIAPVYGNNMTVNAR